MRYYEYSHRVGFEDTNLVGNVYFVNHLRWQGRCREMFLLEHAPEVLVRMRLGAVAQNRITLEFEYWRRAASGDELVARGEQQVACMRREGAATVPTPIPPALREALRPYAAPGALL